MSMLEMAQQSLEESNKHVMERIGPVPRSRSGRGQDRQRDESDKKLRKREMARRFLESMMDKFGMGNDSSRR